MNRARQQDAINAFLIAGDTLAKRGEVVEAEIRFKQALTQADKEFGPHSDQAMLVLSILAAFYHFQERAWEARAIECRLEAWEIPPEASLDAAVISALGKSLRNRAKQTETRFPMLNVDELSENKSYPLHIRKACQVLGLPPGRKLSLEAVNKAWKKEMLLSAAHPDLGGNADEAVILNQAKQVLVEFLESLQPKLGSKFKRQERS